MLPIGSVNDTHYCYYYCYYYCRFLSSSCRTSIVNDDPHLFRSSVFSEDQQWLITVHKVSYTKPCCITGHTSENPTVHTSAWGSIRLSNTAKYFRETVDGISYQNSPRVRQTSGYTWRWNATLPVITEDSVVRSRGVQILTSLNTLLNAEC